MDAFIVILRARRENVHVNFHCRALRPLNSVIKSQVYLKCALQISQFFSVTRTYVHVRWDVREVIGLQSV